MVLRMLVARHGCKRREGPRSAEAIEGARGQVGGPSKSAKSGFHNGSFKPMYTQVPTETRIRCGLWLMDSLGAVKPCLGSRDLQTGQKQGCCLSLEPRTVPGTQ